MIGLGATLIALAALLMGGASFTALEWSIYDGWLRVRGPVAASPSLVVVARDAASEARFGAASWDRAVLARIIGSLARAGAVTVGVDVPLGQPSAPGGGGASSDAMLSQATAQAGNVVYPIAVEPAGPGPSAGSQRPASGTAQVNPSWPALPPAPPAVTEARPLGGPLPAFAQQARGVGHTLATADADGVIRRVPLFVRLEGRAVPAFGLALATAFMNVPLEQIRIERRHVVVPRPTPVRIPTDGRGQALVSYASAEPPRNLTVVPFLDVWTAIEEGQTEKLQSLADDKIVLVLAEPARAQHLTPLGPMSDVAIQTQLLTTVLTGAWLRELPAGWTMLGAFVLSGLAAWLWLASRWWKGLVAAVVLALTYAGSVALSLSLGTVVLPVLLPIAAIVMASAGALLWNQFAAAQRIRHLEDEVHGVQSQMTTVREALVRQESTVEALEEDLEAARVAVARSVGGERELARATGTLRAQLAEAREQEEQTRRRLQELERELGGLRAVNSRPAEAADTEQERLRRECERLGIVTRDPAVLAVFRDLERAVPSSLPILLAGEPGTGKELFAHAAHRLGPRADRPFVAVNMAAISPELFESELFGHVRGGFTGAVGDRKGYFEQADRGTIFLDEIGELRPDHQSKLLRVLQEKSFYRVGATRPTAVDVRVVAASNRDLERGIAEGWFREDLYFRLKGLVLRLPPLRERRPDVALLAARFVDEAAAEMRRPGLRLSEAALGGLEEHDWPGNVRELQHCLRQAVALAEGPVITREDLRLPATGRGVGPRAVAPGLEAGSDTAVLACLRQHAFDMQSTARALGWDRSTVTQRLKGLGFRALVETGGDRVKAALALAGDPALGRTVELKLREYHEHLLRSVQGFDSPEAAIAACRRRFKNVSERHFHSLEVLVRQHFERRPPTPGA